MILTHENIYKGVSPEDTFVARTDKNKMLGVCTVMKRFSEALEGGAMHYPFAFRDSYLSIVLTELANEDGTKTVDALAWH